MSFGSLFSSAAGNVVSVRVVADTAQYKKAMVGARVQGQKFEKDTAAGMQRMGTAIKTGFAVIAAGALIKFGKDTVGASTDLKESINAVNVVFGESAEGILAIGENAADSFGLANSEFNSFAVQFSAFAEHCT